MSSDGDKRPANSVRGNNRPRPSDGSRAPSDKPDVFLHVPDVHVGEIYLDVEDLDAHLSLQARLANLVELVAGVHVHIGKVELDIKDVGAEAMLKVRLENLYEILNRALTTVDRNPEVLQGVLSAAETAVGNVGETARQAVKPGGAVSELADDVGEAGKQALGPGGAVSESAGAVGRAAEGVSDTVSGAVADAGRTVGDAGRTVGDAGRAVGDAGQGVREAAQRAGDVADEAGDVQPRRTRQADTKRRARAHASRRTTTSDRAARDDQA